MTTLVVLQQPLSLTVLTYTNSRTKVHKKRQLTTPSCRFPLRAGGTEGLGSLREAGGTSRRGGSVNFDYAIGIADSEVANALCKRVQRGELSQADGKALLDAFLTAPVDIYPSTPLLP